MDARRKHSGLIDAEGSPSSRARPAQWKWFVVALIVYLSWVATLGVLAARSARKPAERIRAAAPQ